MAGSDSSSTSSSDRRRRIGRRTGVLGSAAAMLGVALALSSSSRAALAFVARPPLTEAASSSRAAAARRSLAGPSSLRLLSSPSPLPATDPAAAPSSAPSPSSSSPKAGGGGGGGQPPAPMQGSSGVGRGETVYKPKGWDREMYRPPDDIMFEWQELLCCLRFMDEKDVNAAMLAPETRDMMIGYAEAIMARGSPVNTIEGVANALMGKWKLAFTTEERYRVLPPATRIYYNIRRDGTMDNVVKFEDKYWDSLVSTARYQLSPQGRLVFEFTSNLVNVNNPFSKGSQFQLPLPRNVGNLGTAFADVSYMDGTMWIEKLRDTATGQLYYTIYEYCGPCDS